VLGGGGRKSCSANGESQGRGGYLMIMDDKKKQYGLAGCGEGRSGTGRKKDQEASMKEE